MPSSDRPAHSSGPRKRASKLIVADPRNIHLARFADVAVTHRLGSDVALLNGMMHIIIKNDWHSKTYIEDTDGRI